MKSVKIKFIDIAYIFAILFPIIPSYFEMGGVAVINVLCFAVILVRLIIGVRKNIRYTSIDFILIFIWILWETIVCLLHGDATGVVVTLLYLLSVIIVAGSLNTIDQFNKMVDCIIYTAGVVAVFGIIESLTGFNVFSVLNTSGATLNYNPPRFGLTRIISSSGHAIEYCSYCMMCLSLTFYRIVNMKKSKKKRVYMIIYVLIFSNAILTLSRSALICMFVCQIVLLYESGFAYFLKTMLKVLLGVIAICTIVSTAVPTVGKAIQTMVYMFLAIFNDNYKSIISTSFGNDNLSAFGNRLDLVGWVIDDMKGHYFLGMGPNVGFNHAFTEYSGAYSWTTIKHSIEVNYLNILWNYGIITLVMEIVCAFKIIANELKTKKAVTENRLSFGKTCGILSICYLMIWLAIAQGTEYKTFILIIALFFAYKRITKQLNQKATVDNYKAIEE